MIFETSKGISPVPQDFVWVAEYLGGHYLSEFDFTTKRKNNFYSIDKWMLNKFGLIGNGMKLYFDSETGTFSLNGNQIQFAYKVKDKIYNLTGYGNGEYNDIITYKDAYTDANIINPNQKFISHIHQYNFGFKKKLVFDDVEFALQIVCCLPYNKPAYMQIKLVANQDLDGELFIKKIGRIGESIHAPLKNDYAGILEWIIN